jgi:hypothetical protein
MLFADDVSHLGGIGAVEHSVHHKGGNVEGDKSVEGAVELAEHHRGARMTKNQDQNDPAHGKPGQLQLQQPGPDVGAAGGAPCRRITPSEKPMAAPP